LKVALLRDALVAEIFGDDGELAAWISMLFAGVAAAS